MWHWQMMQINDNVCQHSQWNEMGFYTWNILTFFTLEESTRLLHDLCLIQQTNEWMASNNPLKYFLSTHQKSGLRSRCCNCSCFRFRVVLFSLLSLTPEQAHMHGNNVRCTPWRIYVSTEIFTRSRNALSSLVRRFRELSLSTTCSPRVNNVFTADSKLGSDSFSSRFDVLLKRSMRLSRWRRLFNVPPWDQSSLAQSSRLFTLDVSSSSGSVLENTPSSGKFTHNTWKLSSLSLKYVSSNRILTSL